MAIMATHPEYLVRVPERRWTLQERNRNGLQTRANNQLFRCEYNDDIRLQATARAVSWAVPVGTRGVLESRKGEDAEAPGLCGRSDKNRRKGGLVLESFDYFKPVSSWTVEEVRAFLRERSAESYNLVDVRQPGEYESGHLPGARLIPIAELTDRLGDLDPSKPTITY